MTAGAGVCVVVYKRPDPTFAQMLRFKGYELEDGKPLEIPGPIAAHAVARQPGVSLVSGDLPEYRPLTTPAKVELRRQRELAEDFPRDPAAVLAALPEIPAVLRKVLAEKDAPAAIEAGKADAHLAWVGMWARLGGMDAAAKAAVRRAETLRLRG